MRRVIAVLAAGFVMMAILAIGAEAEPGGKGGGKGKPTTTTTVVAGSGWVLESLDSGVFDRLVVEVAAAGPGVVAVGRETPESEFGSPGDAAVWTSTDGVTWNRVEHDPSVFGHISLSEVTAFGSGVVAIGRDWVAENLEGHTVVLLSDDGFSWRRVPDDPALVGVAFSDVTVGGPGLVAIGFALAERNQPFEGTVWTSEDGTQWTPIGVGSSFCLAAVTNASALLVAVGDGGIVTSPDAESWTFRKSSVNGSCSSSITSGPTRIVATDGHDMWRSLDGRKWKKTSLPRPSDVYSIAAYSEGFVAVGEADGSAAAWTSPDGRSWSRVPHDPAVFPAGHMNTVTAGGPGLVVFGQQCFDDGHCEPALWTWQEL